MPAPRHALKTLLLPLLGLALMTALTLPKAASAAGEPCTITTNTPVIRGTAGTDVICAAAGDSVIYGGPGDDIIRGGDGGDLIIGGQGADTLRGEAGNDWMRGGTNRDCYDGDAGFDTASFASAMPDNSFRFTDPATGLPTLGGVSVDLNSHEVGLDPPPSCDDAVGVGLAKGEGANEEIVSIERVVGSAFPDVMEGGDNFPSTLIGGWGDDLITGLTYTTPDDTLIGENGRDRCQSNVSGSVSVVPCRDAPEGPHRPAGPVVAVDLDFVNRNQERGLVVLGAEGNQVDNLTVTRPSTSTAHVVSSTPITAGTGCTQVSATVVDCSGADLYGYVMVWGDDGGTPANRDALTIGGGWAEFTSLDVNGGPGDDLITGGASDDTLFTGQGGSDLLYGYGGRDALISEGDTIGSTADDTRRRGSDTLDAGDGDDLLVTDNACAGHTLTAGPGMDIIGFARQTNLGLPGSARGVWARLGEGSTNYQAYAIPEPGGCARSTMVPGGEILEGTDQADSYAATTRRTTSGAGKATTSSTGSVAATSSRAIPITTPSTAASETTPPTAATATTPSTATRASTC